MVSQGRPVSASDYAGVAHTRNDIRQPRPLRSGDLGLQALDESIYVIRNDSSQKSQQRRGESHRGGFDDGAGRKAPFGALSLCWG